MQIGVLCNVDMNGDPREQLSASVINRAFLLGQLLAQDDIRLFLYCPKDVAANGEVPGFLLEDQLLLRVRQTVPRVNANWSYRTRHLLRQGMGYRSFKRWMQEHGHDVYVPYAFSELVSNKQKAYESVRGWDESLHPRTEDFDGSPEQVEDFLARSKTVFLKPRAGHKGNRVFVLRRSEDGYSLEYYDSQARRSFSRLSLTAILGLIECAAGRERYVMQEGIESLRYEDSVFDVRIVMVHDGQGWHSLFESRLSPPGSALSNVYQGGTIRTTRELLAATVGETDCEVVEGRLRQVSNGLAEYFESQFPDALPEIGFDFVIDQDRTTRLVEVNAKPGIAGIGSERKLWEWTAEEMTLHEQWTMPHMTHLAGFLRHKVEAA
jgi:hypothetical protein